MTSEPILVVDDEQAIRDLAPGYLEREGLVVLTTWSGTQALQLVRTAWPALPRPSRGTRVAPMLGGA